MGDDDAVSSLLKSVTVKSPATGPNALLAGGGGGTFSPAAVRSVITFTGSLRNKLLPV